MVNLYRTICWHRPPFHSSCVSYSAFYPILNCGPYMLTLLPSRAFPILTFSVSSTILLLTSSKIIIVNLLLVIRWLICFYYFLCQAVCTNFYANRHETTSKLFRFSYDIWWIRCQRKIRDSSSMKLPDLHPLWVKHTAIKVYLNLSNK